jgi:uncharacterized protein (DUF362 family)/NAD-dependent dihydropyrimidine dehydrogenase PreA subunit
VVYYNTIIDNSGECGYVDDARVFVATASTYEEKELRRALEGIAEAAGGWKEISPAGRPALIKPNLMAAREPSRAVTTHPAFIAVLGGLLTARGRQVLIGDSPAGAVRGIKRVWDKTGAAAAAAEIGGRIVSFEAEGSIARKIDSRFIKEVRVTRFLDDTTVIGAAKLKTHFLTILTGAVKNCLGVIPGLAKADLHRRAPHPDDFAELLVDLLPAIKPRFSFVDGVVGLEGDGPASGGVRNFGLIAGGYNPASVDLVITRILGFEPDEVPTVKFSIERGLTPPAPEIIPVGARFSDLVYDDVATPGSLWLRHLPRPLLRFAGRQFVIRPAVRTENCTGCRRCVESCPVSAAHMNGDVAEIDPSTCIECLCCYETCSDDAVYLKPSRAARWYYALRDFRHRRRRRRNA